MSADKSDAHWMEKAFANAHHQLRRKTHTKPGQNISARALKRESGAKSLKTRRQANLAMTARKMNARRGK
jgi:hypothetical protein